MVRLPFVLLASLLPELHDAAPIRYAVRSFSRLNAGDKPLALPSTELRPRYFTGLIHAVRCVTFRHQRAEVTIVISPRPRRPLRSDFARGLKCRQLAEADRLNMRARC